MTALRPARRWLRPAMTSSRLHLFDTDDAGNLTSGVALCRKSWDVSILARLTDPSPTCRLPHCTDCEAKVKQEVTGEPTARQKSTRDLMRGLKTGRGPMPLPWVERLSRR